MSDREEKAIQQALSEIAQLHVLSAKIVDRAKYHFEKGELEESMNLLASLRPKWAQQYERIENCMQIMFPNRRAPMDHFNSNISNN